LLPAAAVRKPDTQPSAPHYTDNLKTKAPNTTGGNHLYNTLEFLMMGIIVPETCFASNKICNKNHLLHLVGILFPHINEDARSKPHKTCVNILIWTGNFWLRDINFVEMITQRVLLTPMCQIECLGIPARVLGLPYKEIIPASAEIISLVET
jgi:hypothetical protein